MMPFMDYIAREFGHATAWNFDNSYSFLTASSDALLSFDTPTSATLHVSSLSTANFATSYTLSTLGQLDGSISYLYTNTSLAHVPSRAPTIPLANLIEGYRDVPLPIPLDPDDLIQPAIQLPKPTLLHATLSLPPPSSLTGLYARRIAPTTLLTLYLSSQKVPTSTTTSAPPTSLLAHLQHDAGRYSLECLGSSDSALLGVRGLWNFGLPRPEAAFEEKTALRDLGGNASVLLYPEDLDWTSHYYTALATKPSLLSAGAEVYYSPFSHVVGLSTGLRFTTLGHQGHGSGKSTTPTRSAPDARSSKPLAGTSAALSTSLLAPQQLPSSTFPYTLTLTANPIIGSLASTYSIKPIPSISLSSRFDFNVYSWESRYTIGAELWRRSRSHAGKSKPILANGAVVSEDSLSWVRDKMGDSWWSAEERMLKENRALREEENCLKIRADDGWNVGLLWVGRVKSLIVGVGGTVSPVERRGAADSEGRIKRWSGKVGVSIAYTN